MTTKLNSAKPKIAVIGAGDHAAWAIDRIFQAFGFAALVTDGALDRAWSFTSKGAIDAATHLGCPLQDISDPDWAIPILQQLKVDYILLTGTRWILSSEFIQSFPKSVINFHPSDLPKHKGGAVFTWQILNNVKGQILTAHWVTRKIDSGPIIFKIKNEIREPRMPWEFIEGHTPLFHQAIDKIIHLAKTGQLTPGADNSISPQPSSYFPLLNAKINGAIDWRWNAEEIHTFIRVFSHPYKGAFTFHEQQRIHILSATITDTGYMHPFCSGLIIDKTPEGHPVVACQIGALILKEVYAEDESTIPWEKFRLGDRIWTAEKYLDQARTHRPGTHQKI